MSRLTFKKARSLFSYNKQTGIIVWRNKRNRHAGCINGQGYREIMVDRKTYQASHIIWLIVKGRWPRRKMEIDHINLLRSDNRWTNLREATHGQNQANGRAYKNNSTGLKGAGKSDKKNGRYYPYIQHNKCKIRLGGYSTAEEAHAAYAAAAKKYHGQFARS